MDLFKEFSAVSLEEWVEKIQKDLKGKPFEELFVDIEEGITLKPAFHPDDNIEQSAPLIFERINNDWEIGEDIPCTDFAKANRMLKSAIQNGVNSPRFLTNKVISVTDFMQIFEDVDIENISSHFLLNKKSISFTGFLKFYRDFINKKGLNPDSISGGVYFKKFGWKNEGIKADELESKNLKTVAIGSGSEIKSYTGQLTEIIKNGIALIEKNAKTAKEIRTINDKIIFSVKVGTNFFPEIAKIRALKIVWANVLDSFSVKNCAIPPVDVYFSKSSQTKDVNTNMVRATTMAMSAVIGGANRLTVMPADASFKKPTVFSKRLAATLNYILKEESRFDTVIDPAAGSYFIEKLTGEFCEKVWKNI